MKIWNKGFDNDPRIDAFTVGKDRELDLLLAPYDIEGTMAHITMLQEVGLLEADELAQLLPQLEKLSREGDSGRQQITQYTRYLTIAVCVVQGAMVSMGMINPSRLGLPEPASPLFLGSPAVFVFVTTVVLTCTTMVFMWMGEQVTERALAALLPIVKAGEDAVVIAHGGVIGGVLARLFPNPVGRFAFSLEPVTGYTVEFDGLDPVSYYKVPDENE